MYVSVECSMLGVEMSAPREIVSENLEVFFRDLQATPLGDHEKNLIKDLLKHGGSYVDREVEEVVSGADRQFIGEIKRLLKEDGIPPAELVEKMKKVRDYYEPFDQLNVSWHALVAVCGGDPRGVRGTLNHHRLYGF